MEPAAATARERRGVFARFRARVRSTRVGRLLWRVVVSIVGFVVVAIGVVLLPLPGPGWLIIFAGLGILATEYAWAARMLGWVKTRARRSSRWLETRPLWERIVISTLTVILIADLAAGAWFVTR